MHGTAAKLLRDRRDALNLTQWDVSRMAGVREYDISRWETGKTKTLPLLGMWKVSRVLGLKLEDLVQALLADEANAERSDPRAPAATREGSAGKASARKGGGAGGKPQVRLSHRPPSA